MPRVALAAIVRYCETLLRPQEFDDWEGAVNGLQAENRGKVSRLAAAVDASLATAQQAVATGADLLLVHHGLFWAPSYPWTGHRYRLVRFLIENNLAVYSAHLPLDAHPSLGNNAQLCAALGLRRCRPFFECRGRTIGLQARVEVSRRELSRRLEQVLGRSPVVLAGGPEVCRRIGVVTGAAGADLARAAEEGVDTLVTGEGPHWTFPLAEALGVNVFYGGHYATETFGVRALAGHLGHRFRLPWSFVDHPSGL